MTAQDWHTAQGFAWAAADGAGFAIDRAATHVRLAMPTQTPTPAA
jgi:hypothetical protein